MNIRCAVDPYDRKTKQYVVAFLDMLGATNKIRKSETQDESLNIIHNLYTNVMELANPETGIKKYEGIRFKIFSDNILIAKEIDPENSIDSVLILLNCVSNFMCSSVGAGVGWLVRGGITVGDLYIDDTVVWGSALVKAYELENKIAVYPRVIIDKPVLDLLKQSCEGKTFISKDQDGLDFLNYMTIWHFAGQSVKEGFERIKAGACGKDGMIPDSLYPKLYWHMQYINRELNRKNEKKDRKYRLSLEDTREQNECRSVLDKLTHVLTHTGLSRSGQCRF